MREQADGRFTSQGVGRSCLFHQRSLGGNRTLDKQVLNGSAFLILTTIMKKYFFWLAASVVVLNASAQTKSDEAVYDIVDVMPEFPSIGEFRNDDALLQFLSKNTRYPTEAQNAGEKGYAVVQFIVEKDGSITNAKVLRSVSPLCDSEALRVILSMPKWSPGKYNGKVVRVKCARRVHFPVPPFDAEKVREKNRAAKRQAELARQEAEAAKREAEIANSMSWPAPNYDSGWELIKEGYDNYRKWVRWGDTDIIEIICYNAHSEVEGRAWGRHYCTPTGTYKNYQDAEASAYFYRVHGLERTRGKMPR